MIVRYGQRIGSETIQRLPIRLMLPQTRRMRSRKVSIVHLSTVGGAVSSRKKIDRWRTDPVGETPAVVRDVGEVPVPLALEEEELAGRVRPEARSDDEGPLLLLPGLGAVLNPRDGNGLAVLVLSLLPRGLGDRVDGVP
ncbi:MAG: hypothetical protein ACUVYA_17365, partial [Planctomycetota bacterium]